MTPSKEIPVSGEREIPERPKPIHYMRLFSSVEDRVGRLEPMYVASTIDAYIARSETREKRLEDALRAILSLFTEEPKMYLHPCDPNYRMTYGDSDRVDDAFIAAEKALEVTHG